MTMHIDFVQSAPHSPKLPARLKIAHFMKMNTSASLTLPAREFGKGWICWVRCWPVCCPSFVLPRNSLLRRQTDRIKRGQRPVNRGFFAPSRGFAKRRGVLFGSSSSLSSPSAGCRRRRPPRTREAAEALPSTLSLFSFFLLSPRPPPPPPPPPSLSNGTAAAASPPARKREKIGEGIGKFLGGTNMADAPPNLR